MPPDTGERRTRATARAPYGWSSVAAVRTARRLRSRPCAATTASAENADLAIWNPGNRPTIRFLAYGILSSRIHENQAPNRA